MKTLYNKLHIFGQTMLLVFFTLSVLSLGSCSKETLDYNHPDVDLFVKQLKAGKYSTQSPDGLSNMPKFTSEDIEELLKYAEDLTVIPSFPLAPVSYSAGGKLRLGTLSQVMMVGQRVMMAGDLCPCVLKLIKCLVNKTNVVMQLAG